ncbi:MAG: mitochondrial fission ELM1 family protein [Geminicoccaceae bacterium]|nr:mitochondrial fission ELM1 family protein [Geminicoccaceae bacterium]
MSDRPGIDRPPRTWLMLGHKVGDNGQILALAEALGWPYEIKHLVYRKTELLTNLLAGPTLKGLVRERSSPLEPPWPELVISAGRRNEPLVRWIQREAGGPGKVRLVHVGRPWARHECFDLIVTTPQYRLPRKPNILHNEAPLHRVTAQRLAQAAEGARRRFGHLPRPHVAVIMGGNAGPYSFDRENGALLAFCASRMARELGGSVLATSSARTPAKAIDAFEAELSVPAFLYRFQRGDPDNPYFEILASADRLIVTCDSMSMLPEAIATGKPVFIFDLARGPGSHRPPLPSHIARRSLLERILDFRLQPIVYRLGMRFGPERLTRDVGIIHRQQVAAGRAVWLGDPWPPPVRPPGPLRDLERAVAAVKRLFDPDYVPPESVPQAGSLGSELIARLFQ